MNVDNRQKLLAVFAIAAVALLAGDRLVRTPLATLWKARADRVAQWKELVAQGTMLLERERSIKQRWSTMRTNTLAAEVSIAENQVLQAFDRWSRESRVGVTSIKPQWKHAENYATLECRVDAFGSLAALTRFLYDIEKDPLGLKLELVEVTTRDERGEQLTLVLQVSGLQLNQAN